MKLNVNIDTYFKIPKICIFTIIIGADYQVKTGCINTENNDRLAQTHVYSTSGSDFATTVKILSLQPCYSLQWD